MEESHYYRRRSMIMKGGCFYCVSRYLHWEKSTNTESLKPIIYKGIVKTPNNPYLVCSVCSICVNVGAEQTEHKKPKPTLSSEENIQQKKIRMEQRKVLMEQKETDERKNKEKVLLEIKNMNCIDRIRFIKETFGTNNK